MKVKIIKSLILSLVASTAALLFIRETDKIVPFSKDLFDDYVEVALVFGFFFVFTFIVGMVTPHWDKLVFTESEKRKKRSDRKLRSEDEHNK